MNEVIVNIPRLYTAIAEWLFCLLYILTSKKRYNGWKLWVFILGALIILSSFHYVAGLLPLEFWIPGMIVAVALMYTFIYVATNMSFLTAGYFCVQAFVVAEFAASFEWQLYYFFMSNSTMMRTKSIELFFLITVYSLIFISIYLLESRYKNKNYKLDIKQNDLLSFLGLALIVFIVSNVSFLNIKTPISGRYPLEIFYIRTLVNLTGIILLYSQREHKLAVHSKLEVGALQNILNKQYEQYLQSQEIIDLINQKYHDLKHQVSIIRAEKDIVKKEQYLYELENGIKMYEAQYKTGNSVLDTVLTSKSMICLEYDIIFTSVVDGTLLNFMSVMDICSIFGNALDNAIESVRKIKNTEMRLIKLAVFSQNNLLLIRFENYYENSLKFENGNLVSTKNDNFNHGYGIKSIKSVIEKYHGSVKINTVNNWFRLVILIPIIQKK